MIRRNRQPPGEREPRFPFWKDEKVAHTGLSVAALVRIFAVVVALGFLVVCGISWYSYHQGQLIQQYLKERRVERDAVQARFDAQLAKIACVQIEANPSQRGTLSRALTPHQRELIANCGQLLGG